MSLRDLAESDLAATLEDDVTGFGWPVTVTDPSGTSASLVGQTDDIAQVIDPDTGQAVSGRLASVALRISSLGGVGLGLPYGVADGAGKPWLVAFDDVNGNPYTFKIVESNPDRALGLVSCLLEIYE